MTKGYLKQKSYPRRIRINLPIKSSSILSYVNNINYCIDQLNKHSMNGNNLVIGYFLERGLGTRESLHQILSKEEAQELKNTDQDFDYFTLEGLLKEREDIEKGKYIIEEGLIVDFNPAYSNN